MFRIPSGLQQIIPPAAAKKVMELLHQPALTQAVKDAAHKLGWPEIQAPGQLQEIWQQAKQWMESTLSTGHNGSTINSAALNATGLIFNSAMGGVPLPLGIADQASRRLGYVTAQSINDHLRETLCQLTGSEDALVVSSIEHAIGLLNHLPQAADGWLIPRGDYLSWSDNAHLGNCLDIQGRTTISLGSITHCSEQDYSNGLKGTKHGTLHLSPNSVSYPSSTVPSYAAIDLRQLKTSHPVVHVDLLFDGTLVDLENDTFPNTLVASRLNSGTSLVVLPGDRLLGGPACGIIVGKREFISSLRAAAQLLRVELHPLLAAMLQGVITQQADKTSWRQLPVGAMLSNGLGNLKDRARRLEFQIQAGEAVTACRIIEGTSPIGDHLWEKFSLPSVALEIELKDAEHWFRAVRQEKGVDVHVSRAGNVIQLHLRSIDPADDRLLADLFPSAVPVTPTETVEPTHPQT